MLPLRSDPPPPDAGRQAVADRIRELAAAHGQILPKDADLAQLLDAIHANDSIPVTAFAVVADVLFAILNANQRQHHQEETLP
jgi:type III secretion system FlhB-like substrate exporter